ncbi:MotA/TolQ/ExbB proton channel family protein [Agarivorans sp.]|uniref:MotA/TolQ/ExbB proton channel family protein n=1 Tax=Agarivorans sp. TaxID=1872412 RepID=UPI003D0400E5
MNSLVYVWQQASHSLSDILYQGGWVLSLLLVLSSLLASLLLERYWFRFVSYPKQLRRYQQTLIHALPLHWQTAAEDLSRRCDLELALGRYLSLIKNLISLCPLLGLLGTVSGMIEVFDSMALSANNQPQQMAAAIARATLPTMLGMSIALLGLINFTYLKRWSQRSKLSLTASGLSLGSH